MSALGPLVPLVPALVLTFAVVLFITGYRLVRTDATSNLDVEDLVLLRAEQRRDVTGAGPLSRLADRLVPLVRGLIGPAALAWLHRQVELAGRPDGATVDTVLRRGIIWALLVSPAVVVFALSGNLLGLLLAVAAVVVMPLARLARGRRLRQEQLDRDLPDFLDILAVTVTAGVAFRPALARVSERFGGPLAQEMSLTLHQIANGAPVRSAFVKMRQRNDSEALSQFVTAFLQSEELGAPLVESLNQIALDMRRDSAQRMRRKAARVAPRVTLITSLVLVPGTLLLVLVGLVLGSGVDFGALFGGFNQ
jgi:tight adherence protein C